MNRKFELALGLLIFLAVAWVVSQASPWVLSRVTGWDMPRGWGPRSGLFPTVVGIPVVVLAAIQLVLTARGSVQNASGDLPPGADLDLPAEVVRQRTVGILVTIFGFAVAIWQLGFVAAIPLVTFLYLKVAARESWRVSAALAAVAGVVFYVVFVGALKVPTPPGPLLAPFFE